eukprot:gene15839-21964_t
MASADQLEAKDIANMTWAFSVSSHYNSKLFAMLSVEASVLAQSLTPSSSSMMGGTMVTDHPYNSFSSTMGSTMSGTMVTGHPYNSFRSTSFADHSSFTDVGHPSTSSVSAPGLESSMLDSLSPEDMCSFLGVISFVESATNKLAGEFVMS